MKTEHWPLTLHARQRLAQRNLKLSELELVTQFGRVAHAAGATFYFLAARDIPPGREKQLERLIGVTLVLVDGCLVTAYRNRRAWSAIKHKCKWRAVAGGASLQAQPAPPDSGN